MVHVGKEQSWILKGKCGPREHLQARLCEQQAGLQDDYIVFLSIVALTQHQLVNPLKKAGFLLFNYHLGAF